MTLPEILSLLDIKTILAGFVGASVVLVLNSVAKAWKYSKELNKYREILVHFIDKIGITLTEQLIAEATETIKVLECNNHQEYRRLVANRRLEHFPMLNSDIFRNIPMTILKDMLYEKGAFIEVFTFYHCLDYVMEVTPIKAYTENHDFIKAHLKEKKLAYEEEFVQEFENCEVIAKRRKFDINRLRSRITRAEMNVVFLKALGDELRGSRRIWQMKYFFKTLL